MVLTLFCGSVFAVKGQVVPVNNTNETELQKKDAEVKVNASGNWYDYAKVESAGYNTGYAWDGSAYIENNSLYVQIASANDLAFFMKAFNDNRYFFSKSHDNWMSSGDYLYTQTSYKYRQARQVTLLADISMSAHYWMQIGTNSYKFEGDFDGKGHTISGLTYSKGYSSSTTLYYGLFGAVKGSTIQDLCIDVDFSVNNAVNNGMTLYMGALAGYCENATIKHCSVNGELDVSGSSCKESYLGGLIGYAKNTKLRDCNSYLDKMGVSEAGNYYIGGIIGRAVDGGEIYDVSNFGKIKTLFHTNGDIKAVGGIVGGITGTTKYEIWDAVNYLSISTSSASKTSRHIGGILGYGENNVAINRCVNYGNISGSTNKEYIGGIVGRLGHNEEGFYILGIWVPTHANWEKNYVTNCISYGSVSGAGSNKIGYSVGSFKGELRGNYVLGVFGSYITTAGELLNKPSDWDTGKYILYRNGSQYRTAEFFTERSSYNEGGIHEFDFNGNFDNYNVNAEGWCSWHDDGTYSGRLEPNVSTDEAYTVYTWAYTKLAYHFYQSKDMSPENFSSQCALARKYGMNYFRVNFKYQIPGEDEVRDLNNSSLASVTSKGYTPNTQGYIYYFDGAKYGNAYNYGSPYLCDVYYDTNEFTWKSTTSDKIGLGSTSGTNFDFKNLISPVGAGSYSWSNGSYEQTYVGTITYYLTPKPHYVTFDFVDESGNNISGCSTTRSTTFYYGQAYGNLSTVTPAMGYKLSTITASNGNTIYVDVYGNRLGVVSVGTSWIYNTAVTSITFKFSKISYSISAEFTGDDARSTTCYAKDWEIGDNSINVLSDLGYQYSITKLKVGEGSDQREYNVGYGVAVQNNGKSVAGNVKSNGIGSVIVVNTTNLIYGSYQEISLTQTDLILVINRTTLQYDITAKVLVENTLYTDGRGGDLSMTYDGTTKHTDTSGGQFTTSVYRDDDFTLAKNIKTGYKNALDDANNLHYKITYYGTSSVDVYMQEISSINDLFSESFYEIQNVICTLELDVETYQVLVIGAEVDFDLNRCVNLIEKTGSDNKKQYWAKCFAKVTLTLKNDDGNTFMFAGYNLLTFEKSYTFINDPNAGKFKAIKAESIDYAEFNKDDNIATPRIERNVYYISTYKQLAWLSKNNASKDGFDGCIIKLENDIIMPNEIGDNNYNFSPIGSLSCPFKGVFDGQNHIIKNIRFSNKKGAVSDRINYKKYVGLFGAVSGATIKNLTISEGIFSGYSNVGIFAGYAENSTFENLNAYKCALEIKDAPFGDIYEEILITANQAKPDSRINTSGNEIKIQYGDPLSNGTTVELKGINCNTIVVDELRSKIGGIVGRSEGCVFRGVSYNEGTITNNQTNTGVTCYAFAGLADSSTIIDQCFAYCAKTSIQTNVFSNGGTLTDYYLRKGSNNVEGQYEKNNANNWIVVNSKEVLKIFYWHW